MPHINTSTHSMVKLRDLMARYFEHHDLVWSRTNNPDLVALRCTRCWARFAVNDFAFTVWRKYLNEDHPGLRLVSGELDFSQVKELLPKDAEPENEPAGYYDPHLANGLVDELKELKATRKTLRKLTYDNEYELADTKEQLRENERRPSNPLDAVSAGIKRLLASPYAEQQKARDELATGDNPYKKLVITEDEARNLGLL